MKRQPTLDQTFDEIRSVLADSEWAESINRLPTAPLNREQLLGAIAAIEKRFSGGDYSTPLINLYHRLFQALEGQLSPEEHRSRHDFIIVIPVADRPQHLADCLASLRRLCHAFAYGKDTEGRFPKISVLIADDSESPANQQQHRRLAEENTAQGIVTHYFGIQEQLALLNELTREIRQNIQPIIGKVDRNRFSHKGASITRNLAYLKLYRITSNQPKTLIHFIDSDQEFGITRPGASEDQTLYAVNFFNTLDRLFQDPELAVLTGKVVGDPPVSPAVMAGNLLLDIEAFFDRLSTHEADGNCTFHARREGAEDAAYHDMADLFGFTGEARHFPYPCPLREVHNHRHCLTEMARRLERFFDGEHPTRKSYYVQQPIRETLTPARTIYTGNYVIRRKQLQAFIPFAPLNLRMAGPVLGRLLRQQLGNRFCSTNLPMRHKRTSGNSGRSEFRPGVVHEQAQIDLSGEFERQYFGDVMLFSIETLTAAGFPRKPLSEEQIRETVLATTEHIDQRYREKRGQILEHLAAVENKFNDEGMWWQHDPALASTRQTVDCFFENIRRNFTGEITDSAANTHADARVSRLQQIINAIAHLHRDSENWRQLLTSGLLDQDKA